MGVKVMVDYHVKGHKGGEDCFHAHKAEFTLDPLTLQSVETFINTMIACGALIQSVTYDFGVETSSPSPELTKTVIERQVEVDKRRKKLEELVKEGLDKKKLPVGQQANWPQFYCGPPWANGIGYTLHFAQHVPVYNPNEIMLDSSLKTW